jgi:uracil-DNA glycosylase family 4
VPSPTELLRSMVHAKGLTYVGTRGTPGDPVVVVGEAPGADEDRLKIPFVGVSGKELGRMFDDAGWRGSWQTLAGTEKLFCPYGVWYTNVFKVRPPANKIALIGEYGIPLDVFTISFIDELRTYKPKIIIATGNTSLGVLCPFTIGKNNQARIGTFRGSLLKSSLLDWEHYVLPMYHPAFILREWSERPVGVLCIERGREEFEYYSQRNQLQPLPERKIRVQPSYQDLVEFLRNCLYPVPRRVSNDIELIGGRLPYTIAIAISPWDCVAFTLAGYTTEQNCEIWILLNEILRTCPQIGQNYIGFDCTWLEWLSFEPNLEKIDDTMVLHHVLWPELPHKLQFLTMQYTREPYYKDEGRKWKPRDGIARLLRYNGLDSCVTFEALEAMEKELEERVLGCSN